MPPDCIVKQWLGAFLAHGVTLELSGQANDYVGKGLSGGKLIVYPPSEASFEPHNNLLIGNTVLYGATGHQNRIGGVLAYGIPDFKLSNYLNNRQLAQR